jgi:hypothetical protein
MAFLPRQKNPRSAQKNRFWTGLVNHFSIFFVYTQVRRRFGGVLFPPPKVALDHARDYLKRYGRSPGRTAFFMRRFFPSPYSVDASPGAASFPTPHQDA